MHAWNAFNDTEQEEMRAHTYDYGAAASWGSRPDRQRFRVANERSIITAVYNRMALDISGVDIRHVRLDGQKRYLEDVPSGLNYCLTEEANIDQAARQFRKDIVMTLFDKGVAAIVPVDVSANPLNTGGYDIKTMRVGTVTQWLPKHVKVELYNENKGLREEIMLPKKMVAIVENPLYEVMNEQNSTLQRLIRKIGLLDTVDEKASSGKLDMIIQLPYVIKSDARRTQAENRRKDLEFQLQGSKYGIAYTDGTEKITQLNRPVENNLLPQIESLTKLLYSQLGLTEEVMNGTASEEVMLNYNNRTVEPVVSAIVEEMRRTFLTRTARSQKQWIMAFRDPFKLVPIANIAEIADKFTRNEIMTSNEIRGAIGMAPAEDPKADELVNSNMPQPAVPPGEDPGAPPPADDQSLPNIGDETV
jgi:hypothetical protein